MFCDNGVAITGTDDIITLPSHTRKRSYLCLMDHRDLVPGEVKML